MIPQTAVLIVGGTAAYGLDLSAWRPVGQPVVVDTPYGPSPPIRYLRPHPPGPPVAFCSRHGQDTLRRSAAFLNHRAILWAAKALGARTVLSWNGVGAMDPALEVGDLIVPSDLLDFTRTRITTFGSHAPPSRRPGPVFEPEARRALLQAAAALDLETRVHAQGVYVCTEGPRLETQAEIEFYRRAGAHVVGMTLSPEVFLAQELGIGYASLGYVTNYATGRALGRPPRRQFGPVVAHTCLPVLLHAANILVS